METELIFSQRACLPLVPWNHVKHVFFFKKKNVHVFIMKLELLAVPLHLNFFSPELLTKH